jgi:hypothetical protein
LTFFSLISSCICNEEQPSNDNNGGHNERSNLVYNWSGYLTASQSLRKKLIKTELIISPLFGEGRRTCKKDEATTSLI